MTPSGRICCALVLALAGLLTGCVHLTHPAGVRPGWFAEAGLGSAREHYEKEPWAPADQPASGDVRDFQVNLGRGWRFSPNSGLIAGLLVPLSAHGASPLGSLAATSLDLYWQFLGRPLDLGVGGVLGVNGGVYLEAGKTVPIGPGRQVDIALGVMALGGYDIGAPRPDGPLREFGVVRFQGDRWSFAVWADHEAYPERLGRCDDDCQYDDFLEKRWSGGVALGWRSR
jgi:hypothetical protein